MNIKAFARAGSEFDSSGDWVPAGRQDGMTLRDYFAAKAMQSVIATVPHDVQIESPYELASWSYAMADRMLKARGE